jgi:threonylcarbamoyladenosine tRNA methylthiotransferase MtaB
MLALPGIGRLRLSSIEINEVTDDLIALMTRDRRLCRHLHISLQSGCDKILRLMNRPYDTAYFRERVAKLRQAMPEIAISTDIIVGFPGETGADFVDTCRFAEEIAFSKIHVFSFSAHEKTAAYQLPDRVPLQKIKQRSQIMRDLSSHLEKKYEKKIRHDLKGQEIEVVIERIKNGRRLGKTEFHFDVELPAENKSRLGSLTKIRL